MEGLPNRIGKRILSLRKSKHLSQERLAYLAEIDRTYMTDVENGKKNVSVLILEKIARALDTNLTNFFNDDSFK